MKFHHIGYACRDLEAEMQNLASLGYKQEGIDFIDPLQGIKGRFLYSASAPRLELLVSYAESKVLDPWLAKGIKMYHLAYFVDDLNKELSEFQRRRARVVVKPLPSVAFGGNRICFLLLPNMLLIELIESKA